MGESEIFSLVRTFTSSLFAAVLLACPSFQLQAGESSPEKSLPSGFQRFQKNSIEVSFDTAVLFGIRNQNDYVLAPQMISVLWQPFEQWNEWWLPTTISAGVFGIAMPVINGPESFYGGGGLMTRSRWLFKDLPIGLVLDSRAGIGAIDSRGVFEGQGQDLTFVLQTVGSVEWYPSERWTLRAGFLWQHLSNADLSEPKRENTGLDAIGPQIGIGYLF